MLHNYTYSAKVAIIPQIMLTFARLIKEKK